MEGLQCFLNALTGYSEHRVGAWTIFYTLVKVRGSWKLLIVVRKAPRSLSVNYEACHIDRLHEYSGLPLTFLECFNQVFQTTKSEPR